MSNPPGFVTDWTECPGQVANPPRADGTLLVGESTFALKLGTATLRAEQIPLAGGVRLTVQARLTADEVKEAHCVSPCVARSVRENSRQTTYESASVQRAVGQTTLRIPAARISVQHAGQGARVVYSVAPSRSSGRVWSMAFRSAWSAMQLL